MFREDPGYPDRYAKIQNFKSGYSGFLFFIAMTIAIENRSGKNGIRFSFFDRSAFFPEKTHPDFSKKIGSRLEFLPKGAVAAVKGASSCVHM